MLLSYCERDEGWGEGAEGERENAPWPPPINIVLPDGNKRTAFTAGYHG